MCTWPHFESEGFWNSEEAYSTAKLRNLCIAQQRESKTVPRRGFRILCQWILDSGFQSLVGFRIPLAVFRISKPGFSDSARKTPRRAVFPEFRNLDSLCMGWFVGCRSLTKCFKNYMGENVWYWNDVTGEVWVNLSSCKVSKVGLDINDTHCQPYIM